MDDTSAVRWKGSQEYWEKLAEIYADMFQNNPRSPIFVPLAGALYHAGMASRAVDTLETGLALLPNNRAGMTLLARLRLEAGDAKGARDLLRDVVNRWPDATAAVTMLCRIHENDGLYEEAEKISSVLLDYFPDSKQVSRLHGKYKALAWERLNAISGYTPSPQSAPQSAPVTDAAEHAPDTPVAKRPDVLAGHAEMDKTRPVSSIEEYSPAAGAVGESAIVPSTATDIEEYRPPQIEEKPDTRTRKRRNRGEPSERQLTLIKLESLLSGISKLRK